MKILDKYTISILVEMCMEFPKKTIHWAEISEALIERGELDIILDAVDERRRQQHKEFLGSLTDEERAEEDRKNKKMKDNPDGFYGNMGNPEYPLISKKNLINNNKEVIGINNEIKFDSSFLVHFPDMLNSLTIRLFINGEENEIKFYDVWEFEELIKKTDFNFFKEYNLNDWKGNIKYCNTGFFEQEKKSELKFFSLKVDKHEFNILATGYVKLKGFNESYRKQIKIKSIIE